jgi:hypothetical protein
MTNTERMNWQYGKRNKWVTGLTMDLENAANRGLLGANQAQR